MGIRTLVIENFRGVKSMTCENLARITLIGGRNNSGKTSLLEAIKMLSSRRDASTGADINVFVRRIGLRQKDDLRTLFNDCEAPFRIKGLMCNGTTSSLSVRLEKTLTGEITPGQSDNNVPDTSGRLGWNLHHRIEDVSKDGMIVDQESQLEPRLGKENDVTFSYTRAKTDDRFDWNCMFLSGYVRGGSLDTEIVSKMTIAQQDRDLSRAISKIYPEIYTVKLVNDQLMVKVRGYENLLPAKVAGDGVARIISILCCLWNCKDGCLCVDEIDNGLHYSVLLDFWKSVFEFADKFNVQLLATTHHLDLLETLNLTVKRWGRQKDVCYLRLSVDEEGRHFVSHFSGEDLDRALEMGFEVRG